MINGLLSDVLINMKLFNKIIFGAFAVILMTVFFSCEDNFKEVQKSIYSEFTPNGESYDFDLKYTDSGRIKSVLISPKMLDYSTVQFPFTEFPDGLKITMYEKNGSKTFIVAKSGTTFKNTNLIDLKGSVKISNESGQLLETDQLYFDQKNEWFFTEKRYKFTDPKGVSYGEGLDFSKDFKIINSQQISGEVENSK